MKIPKTERINAIQQRLEQALQPSQLDIRDDSQHHIGHAGAQSGAGHYHVTIASKHFDGKNKLQCHRLIYQALDDMMPEDIHALSIQIK